MRGTTFVVVAGLDPAIHSVSVADGAERYGVDGRVKPCHDDRRSWS
jgi:hypothetical protein